MENQWKMRAPIALIIFNRPAVTARVFEVIKQVRPSQLFLIADGPRKDVGSDVELCQAARAVVEEVDWPCEVHKNFSDANLGCGRRPATGISWVFEHVDKAIILEDDCLPHPTFFRFCDELLERYLDDTRIMHIAGYNRGLYHEAGEYSYYFSRLPLCWGWATWRRAWCHFDFDMKHFEEISETDLWDGLLGCRQVERFWEKRLAGLKQSGKTDIWDFQWDFSCWIQHGLSIIPNTNLIRNIGLGKDATHTREFDSRIFELEEGAIGFPLHHPPYVIRDARLDVSLFREIENGFYYRNFKKLLKVWERLTRFFC